MSDTQTTDAPNTDTTSEAQTTEEKTTPETTSEKTTEEQTSDGDLGDAGKKAIKAERDARKTAEKELAEIREEVSRLRRSNAAQKGTDVEAIKSEIRAEFAAQLAETAIKAEAKGRMNDPADALLYIKPADVAEGEDAIKEAIDKLLTEKPYLAAQDGRKHWGDVGGGQRTAPEPEPSTPQERIARAYSKSSR